MDFRTAYSKLSEGMSEEAIAAATDIPIDALREAANKSGGATAPEHWEKLLAHVARDRARELEALADELHPVDVDPNWEDRYG